MTTHQMGKADLHIHTEHGDGLDSVASILEHVAEKTDLDVIAITEHDSVEVALAARELWARRNYRFDFVPGVEVTTLEGHVIALYLEAPVPSLRRVEETLEAVHRQGGLCFIPHPMSWLTRSIGPSTLRRVTAAGLRFDAMELYSANPTTRFYMEKARRLNEAECHLPGLGASDAHFVQAIGSAYSVFEGRTGRDLRAAIENGSVGGGRKQFPSLREIGLRRALSVPLSGLASTPRRLGWRRTAWSFVYRYWA